MPIAEVELEDGRVLELEVGANVTEQQIADYIASNPDLIAGLATESDFMLPAGEAQKPNSTGQAPIRELDDIKRDYDKAAESGDSEKMNRLIQEFDKSVDQAPEDSISFFEGLQKGFARGVRQPLTGLTQLAYEKMVPILGKKADEFQAGLFEGKIPATEENIRKFESLQSQWAKAKNQLESSYGAETIKRKEFEKVQKSAPVSSFVGQAGGQIAGLPVTPSPASTLIGRSAQAGAIGGLYGAAQPREEEGGIAGNVATGVALGSIAAPVAERVAAPLSSYLVDKSTLAAQKLFNYKGLSKAQKSIMEEIAKNPRNPNFAKFETVQGKPMATQRLKKAIKQYGQPEPVAVFKASSKADKEAVKKMLDTIKKGKLDPLYAQDNRVGDVVGESLKRRVIDLKGMITESGKKIDRVVKNQLKGKTVNIQNAKAQFESDLQNLRVGYDPKTGDVNFSGSALEGTGGAQARDLVKKMALKLKNDTVKAEDAHFAKRFIDQKTAFGTSDRGLSGEIDRAIKKLRSNINQSLRDSFPNYAKANQKYSDSLRALDDFQNAAGAKVNLDDPQALGTKARSFTNNTQSRARLKDSLLRMQETLSKYGKTYDDDIGTQVFAANALEERFRTQGSTAFRSEIAKGIEDVATRGARETIFDRSIELFKKFTGASDDEAIESLMDILD